MIFCTFECTDSLALLRGKKGGGNQPRHGWAMASSIKSEAQAWKCSTGTSKLVAAIFRRLTRMKVGDRQRPFRRDNSGNRGKSTGKDGRSAGRRKARGKEKVARERRIHRETTKQRQTPPAPLPTHHPHGQQGTATTGHSCTSPGLANRDPS